jgi:cyanophycin synthetase
VASDALERHKSAVRSPRRFFSRFYWRVRARRFVTRFVHRTAVRLSGLPLVVVTGTNGKTAVTLLISRILCDAGYRTGCACTEGVLADGEWIVRGDEAGSRGLWWASRRPGLQALVAETARGGILRYGLGFSLCHVSVVTNVYADHLGLYGVTSVEEMAAVKSILPERTRRDGVTVLNGDQPLVRDMASKSAARVVYFTLAEPLESWENCWFVRDGAIYCKRGPSVERVVDVERVQLAYGGAVRFQIANAMAAMAAVEGLRPWLPVSRSSIEHTLATFGRDPHDLPGRMQLFRYEGADVLVSSSKNPETYSQEIPVLQRLARAHGYRRVICVVSNVGNRDRAHFQAVSRAVAALGDLVVCVPPYPHLLRGRTGEEIVRLLESEVPAEKIVRPRATRLPDVIAELQRADSPSTLFVAFASRVSSAIDVDDIVARGEPIPMRFDS